MSNTQDLTQGNVTKIILAFYFPMYFTNLLQQIYTFADTAIVGRGLGDSALAAVGNMGSLNFLIIGFSIGLGNGFSVLIARFFGAKDFEKLRHCFAALIQLTTLLVVVLTILSTVFLYDALKIINTDESIIGDSLKYGHIIFGGLAVTILYNVSASVLRALGDSRTPLYAIVASTITNIALDYFFIFILKTGVEGAAIATIMAQFLSALICLFKIIKIDVLKLKMSDMKNEFAMYRELLKNGVPMAFMNSLTAVGCMVVQAFVNNFGVAYTAAYSACSKYINMFMQPAFTTTNTISSFAGQNFGAKKYDRIKKGMYVCFGIAIVAYVVLGSTMFFFPRFLATILLSGEESITLACQFFKVCGVTLIFVDLLFVFRGTIQGMGFPFIPMMSGLFEMVLRVSVIVGFSSKIGFVSTAFAETSAWLGALLMNAIAFFYYYRKITRSYDIKEVGV